MHVKILRADQVKVFPLLVVSTFLSGVKTS